MKKNLEILDFEDKKTNAGKRYVRFKTSDGWMSCFDVASCEALKKFEGGTASVEIVESGEFKNIKKCYGESSDEDLSEVVPEKPGEPSAPKAPNRNTTMYVSYAKDIFCAIVGTDMPQQDGKPYITTEAMKQSIALVKQAREAFE